MVQTFYNFKIDTTDLKIVKNDKLYEHAFLNITKEGFKFV